MLIQNIQGQQHIKNVKTTLIDITLSFKRTDQFTLCQTEECVCFLITHIDVVWFIVEK